MARSELSLAFDVVAPERCQIPNIKSSIGYNRIGPGFRVAAVRRFWRSKSAFFLIRVGFGFHERNFAVFAMQIEVPISVTKRGSADGFLLPFNVASGELRANQPRAGCSVEIIADLHCAADARWELGREINLLDLKPIIFGLEFDEPASTSASAAVDVRVVSYRCRNICRAALGRLVVAPKKFATLRIHADQPLLEKLHVLFRAADVHDNRGSISRLVSA